MSSGLPSEIEEEAVTSSTIVGLSSAVSFDETQRVETEKMLATKLQQTTAAIVRASNSLPKMGDGYELYASYSDFAKFMEQQRLRIILAMRKLLTNLGCRVKITAFALEDMERLISANDLLVERAGISLEEHQRMLTQEFLVKTKVNTGAEAVPGSSSAFYANNVENRSLGVKDGGRYALAFGKSVESVRLSSGRPAGGIWESSSVLVKPQKAFQNMITNADLPFVPKLVVKHNALEAITKSNLRIIDENSDGNNFNSKNVLMNQTNWLNEENFSEHPYNHELIHLFFSDLQLTAPENIKDLPKVDETPMVFVDSEDALHNLVVELNKCKEFAVDVEHHSHRSFLGLTCLIQISTRTVDYIIDPFPIWKSMNVLNEPFSNPNIVKVFHGGDQDIVWLQRDFGVYVVNLFDTAVAMRYLNFRRLSLKHLLHDFCGIELNKELQKADWRIRPLPEAFLHYARLDSHYLLYCYDKLRQHLAKNRGDNKSSIKEVFTLCKKISGKLFEQPRFNADGFYDLISANRPLNNRQFCALKQLWRWRDATAREHDESLHYVLPTHMMLLIAEALPREPNGVLACCAPVPPLVKHDLPNLFKFIATARELPLKKLSHQALSLETSNADSDNTSRANVDSTLESNRITRIKAKLEFRMDCTNYKANEEIPTAEARLSALMGSTTKLAVEEKDEDEAPFIIAVRGKNGRTMVASLRSKQDDTEVKIRNGFSEPSHVYVTDEFDRETQENTLARLKRVHEKLNKWQLPYNCYLATKRHLKVDESENGSPPAKQSASQIRHTDTITTTAAKTIKTETISE